MEDETTNKVYLFNMLVTWPDLLLSTALGFIYERAGLVTKY